MITRFAIFEGSVKPGQTEAMRAYVNEKLAPLWRQFEGALEVRVLFGAERDESAPDIPLMLAITYPDRDAMARALACDARYAARDLLAPLFEHYLDAKMHHHVMETQSFTD